GSGEEAAVYKLGNPLRRHNTPTVSSPTAAPPVARPASAPAPWPGVVADRIRAWSYYRSADLADRRDLRVDLLRGFCIFAMVVDHFGGESWLYAITAGNRFYVSPPQGVIFINP